MQASALFALGAISALIKIPMKKNEIGKIANKLGWEFEETEEAIKELLHEKSIIKDWKKFFNMCLATKDPHARMRRVIEYLNSQLPNKKSDLVEIICDWLHIPDPCFSVWALYNIADLKKERRNSYYWWKNLRMQKSFKLLFTTKTLPGIFYSDNLYDPSELCDHYLSRLVKDKEEYVESISADSFLLAVVARVGFLAFNVSAFRAHASWYSLDPPQYIYAKELAGALSEKYLSNTDNTDRKYWLYYVLVEILLKEKEFESTCREVERLLNVPYKTIRRRYFERKKKLNEIKTKNPTFGISNIITEFYLAPAIKRHLKIDTSSSYTEN
ncbi:MAG: hypothetical protein DHS20C13_13140 [Thermodesulfobacteriota bacterium]|nr:MAG: hypothetical protein DHS20C13_13140 [Thermodesulfobacteriota bacterium]